MQKILMVLLLTAALAGCSDKAEGTEGPASASETAAGETVLHAVQFVAEPRFVGESYLERFSTADSEQPSARRTIDISDLLVDGPNFVTVDVTPEDSAVEAFLQSSDFGDLWSYDKQDNHIESAVDGGGTIAVVLQYGGLLGTPFADNAQHVQGVEYTVEVTVQAAPDKIPSGMAIEVELPSAGSRVIFTGTESIVPDILVYGPDDVFVGVLPGGPSVEMTLEENSTTGKYVFLPKGHGAFYSLQLATPAEDETYRVKARLLEQLIESSNLETVPDAPIMAAHEWTQAAPQIPIQAGACLFTNQGALLNAGFRMTGPDGAELMNMVISGVPAANGCLFTDMGDSRLTAGEYLFDMNASNAVGVQAQSFLMFYGR